MTRAYRLHGGILPARRCWPCFCKTIQLHQRHNPRGKLTVMRTSLHRRIVAVYRLDTLGSACSLLPAVSRRKNSYQLFYACYDFATPSRQSALIMMSQTLAQKAKKEHHRKGGALLFGSPNWARTSDIMINSHALYRLSYRGI